jgi:hypothetical protein
MGAVETAEVEGTYYDAGTRWADVKQGCTGGGGQKVGDVTSDKMLPKYRLRKRC